MSNNKISKILTISEVREDFITTPAEWVEDFNAMMLEAGTEYQYREIFQSVTARLNQWPEPCKQPGFRTDLVQMARFLRLAMDRLIEGEAEASVKELVLCATAMGVRCLLTDGADDVAKPI